MIPFEFSYARPETVEEALTLWRECDAGGKQPVYYSGGTEIITLCREMKIKPDLLIDIKSIEACNVLEQHPNIAYGAALSLNTIAAQSVSRLVSSCFSAIADRTVRNRVTLGGNILGHLPFREALLPFLVLGGKATVAGDKGLRELPLSPFNKRVHLEPGEFVTGFSIDAERIGDPCFYIRNQKDSPVDYPILTACFSGKPGQIAMAVTGAFSSPVRDQKAEAILNQTAMGIPERCDKAAGGMSASFKTDFRATADYRHHLLKQAIEKALKEIEG